MTWMNHLRHKTAFKALAIIAVLLPAFVQFAQALPSQGPFSANSNTTQDTLANMVICTTYGVVAQSLKLDIQNGPKNPNSAPNPSNTNNAGGSCPVCLSFTIASNILVKAAFFLVVPQQTLQKVRGCSAAAHVLALPQRTHHPRAPPSYLTV